MNESINSMVRSVGLEPTWAINPLEPKSINYNLQCEKVLCFQQAVCTARNTTYHNKHEICTATCTLGFSAYDRQVDAWMEDAK